jgi:hypothetical protein
MEPLAHAAMPAGPALELWRKMSERKCTACAPRTDSFC